jgi:hypothetical protein
VERFQGKIVEYDSLTDFEKTYVLNTRAEGSEEWIWLLADTDAKYANRKSSHKTLAAQTARLIETERS